MDRQWPHARRPTHTDRSPAALLMSRSLSAQCTMPGFPLGEARFPSVLAQLAVFLPLRDLHALGSTNRLLAAAIFGFECPSDSTPSTHFPPSEKTQDFANLSSRTSPLVPSCCSSPLALDNESPLGKEVHSTLPAVRHEQRWIADACKAVWVALCQRESVCDCLECHSGAELRRRYLEVCRSYYILEVAGAGIREDLHVCSSLAEVAAALQSELACQTRVVLQQLCRLGLDLNLLVVFKNQVLSVTPLYDHLRLRVGDSSLLTFRYLGGLNECTDDGAEPLSSSSEASSNPFSTTPSSSVPSLPNGCQSDRPLSVGGPVVSASGSVDGTPMASNQSTEGTATRSYPATHICGSYPHHATSAIVAPALPTPPTPPRLDPVGDSSWHGQSNLSPARSMESISHSTPRDLPNQIHATPVTIQRRARRRRNAVLYRNSPPGELARSYVFFREGRFCRYQLAQWTEPKPAEPPETHPGSTTGCVRPSDIPIPISHHSHHSRGGASTPARSGSGADIFCLSCPPSLFCEIIFLSVSLELQINNLPKLHPSGVELPPPKPGTCPWPQAHVCGNAIEVGPGETVFGAVAAVHESEPYRVTNSDETKTSCYDTQSMPTDNQSITQDELIVPVNDGPTRDAQPTVTVDFPKRWQFSHRSGRIFRLADQVPTSYVPVNLLVHQKNVMAPGDVAPYQMVDDGGVPIAPVTLLLG